MDAIGFVLIAVIVFMTGWNLMGTTDIKTTAVITGAAAFLMGALVVFQGATVFSSAVTAPIGTLLLLWAIYGALVAATGFSETGGRALGLYSLFLSVAMAVFAIYFAAHAIPAGIIVTAAVGISFFLQFLAYVIPSRGLQRVTGWFLLVSGIVSAFAGFGLYIGLMV